MNGQCVCGHGSGNAHQGGTGACVGYTVKKGTPKRANRKLVKCICRQFKAAA